jgi:hypothetical protein
VREEEKRSMRWAVHLTLNECHRNWRFYKLWLLIRLGFAAVSGFATLAMSTTGKRGDDQKLGQRC